MSSEKWDVNQSRSVRSGWIWRGFFMLSMLAVGIAIIFLTNHLDTLAALWGVIAFGWFATALWLWRRHTEYIKN